MTSLGLPVEPRLANVLMGLLMRTGWFGEIDSQPPESAGLSTIGAMSVRLIMTLGSPRASNCSSSLSGNRALTGIGVPPALKTPVAATRQPLKVGLIHMVLRDTLLCLNVKKLTEEIT